MISKIIDMISSVLEILSAKNAQASIATPTYISGNPKNELVSLQILISLHIFPLFVILESFAIMHCKSNKKYIKMYFILRKIFV